MAFQCGIGSQETPSHSAALRAETAGQNMRQGLRQTNHSMDRDLTEALEALFKCVQEIDSIYDRFGNYVIDNSSLEALIEGKKILSFHSFGPENSWRPTENANGHKWGFWRNLGYESCMVCGLIRRADKTSSPCKGESRINTNR